ncbi:MAG: monovalent cation/H+ antiporter subunit D family protein [Alphaproteobacteria bacterium]|nr:monovalent cation/H+ antiporter subunit D family protein [Alphaproteobacteria bacterium]
MSAQLPILQVLLPLLAAPLCAILRGRALPHALSVGTVLLSLLVTVGLLIRVESTGTISYAIGGWPPPIGIEYRVDQLSVIVLLIIQGVAAAVLVGGGASIVREIEATRAPLFYALFLLNLTGLTGMVLTGDLFNLFVFLEISSLSTYVLVALGTDRRALLAAYQYLVIGTVGATFYVIGVGLLYMMTGTLNMADLADRVAGVEESTTIRTAFAFMIIGIGVKLGMMPVHFWLPNAYARAPSVVSAFLAATSTKVAVYIMLRVVFEIFGVPMFLATHLSEIIIGLGILAMVVASVTAIFQDDVKRLLAYSSLAQIGYILFAFGLATEPGVTASVLHLFNHGLMKGALFLALAAVALRAGRTRRTDLDGLGQAMPLTMLGFTLAGLSLIGVPGTVGFISKWYLLEAAFDRDGFIIAAIILGSSLLAILYVWPLVERAYFRKRDPALPPVEEAPLPMLIGIWLLVGANLLFGVWPDLATGLAERSALLLLGGAR